MGLMDGKRCLIVGVGNDKSIAWGIAQAFQREGATLAFTYANEAFEKRVRPLAHSLGVQTVLPCDVSSDTEIAALMTALQAEWGSIDVLVHSVAYGNKDELDGPYLRTSREGFRLAMDISVYSLTALLKAAEPILAADAAILTLTYHGSTQVVANYNVQGLAKAALEASVRYLANDLGPRGIRVNAISPGPIATPMHQKLNLPPEVQQQFAAGLLAQIPQ